MSTPKCYEVLAGAFAEEGVSTVFALLGDANMYWLSAMIRRPGLRAIHVRHEHCAVAAAEGYARLSGEVGVAAVTCGPGFTQTMTALTVAARGNVPLVVFVGDAPTNAGYFTQQIEQAPLALATGAAFVPVRHAERLLDAVREAFYIARSEQRPVVLDVPLDIQRQAYPHSVDYLPSAAYRITPQSPHPDPAVVQRLLGMIDAAERPIIIAGRAFRAGGARSLEALAEQCGALLATSLHAKGLFDHDRFCIGIAGTYASDLGRELFSECDLVIGFGASMGYHTSEAGYLWGSAEVVQVDLQPRGLWQGLRIADLHVRADACATADILLGALRARGPKKAGLRTPEIARRIADDVPDSKVFAPQPDCVDPRAAFEELDRAVPKDWDIVAGGGHFLNFAVAHLRGRSAERWQIINHFGAIGQAFSTAIGAAVRRGDGKLLLLEGDGGFTMHAQELDTVRRHGIRLLICVFNDGGYGAEAHKLAAHGLDSSIALHGRGDLAAVAAGFGLGAERVKRLGHLAELVSTYQSGETAMLIDIHTDPDVISRQYRRIHFGEA